MKTCRAAACSLAGLLSLLAAARPAAADPHPNTQGGVAVAEAFQLGDVDNINLFNGALTVALPIGIRFPVNGSFSYQLILVANSNPWDFSDRIDINNQQWQDSAPSHCSNAGLGWRVSLGALGLASNPSPPTCAPTDVDTPASTLYEAPDGSQHLFYSSLHPNEPVTANVMYTRDGTYLRLNLYSGYSEIQFPDGTVHRFGADGRIVQMRDAFNDQVNIAYLPITSCPGKVAGESSCWQISDTQGRVHWIYFRNDLAPYTGAAPYSELISRVVPMAFNGAVAPYQFNYQAQTIARGCPVNDPMLQVNGNYPVSVPLLTSVTRPGDSSFAPGAAGYLTTAGSGCLLGSGSLTALTLPTLGTLGWTYQQYVFPSASSVKPRRTSNPGIQTRTTSDARGNLIGSWSYNSYLASNTVGQLVNTMSDPLGNQHVRYFSVSTANAYGPGANLFDYGRPYTPNTAFGSLFLSEQVFDGGGNLKRTSYVRYGRDVIDNLPVPDVLNNNGREAQRETVYDDGSQGGYLNADFDGVGHYRYRSTDGTFAGNNKRVERHQYNPNRWTYDVVQSTNSLDATYHYLPPTDPWILTTSVFAYATENGVSELRSFCYDTTTGFLKRRRLYVQSSTDPGATSANDVVQQFVPDGGGNVMSELSFGGDNAPFAPTSSDLCAQALPTSPPEYQLNSSFIYGVKYVSQYVGTGFYSLNRGIDQATGLPTYSRDTAGIQTNFTYDALGRLAYVLPHDGAWTQYLYHPASSPSSLASLTVIQQQNGSPSISLAQTKASYDALGRLIEQDVQMPDGTFSATTTSYNGLGWKTAVSAQGSPNTNLTQYLNYDPFGRATLIRPPDSTSANGFVHDVKLSFAGVQTVRRTVSIGSTWDGTSVHEAPSTTTETYDRFGRLASVSEPSGNGGIAVTTSYLYDAGNRLSQVATTAAGTTQTRTFSYDHRGFLAWETHPETAPNYLGDGHHKDYLSYDSRGHFHRTVEGSNDLSYTYDTAERPKLVYNTAYGANCNPNPITTPTCVKQFTYDNVAAGALGRLSQASRFNHILYGGSPNTDEWTYTYTYAGLDGRVSQRTLQHTFNGQATGAQESFTQAWTYTQLGKIDTETYPNCAATFTACSGTTGLAPKNLYANGFLTGVNGYTPNPGITYYPNGMVSGVTHLNGVTTAYGLDPFGIPRPASITATGPPGVEWSTGPYAYDGAGNVTQMGHAGYDLYDGVSRLTTSVVQTNAVDSTVAGANTTVSQTMTYDAFGNLQSMLGNSGRNTTTNSATNQLSGGTYDASGNLRTWNGASYDYDELDKLKHYVNGTQEWFYMYDADDERVWSFQTPLSPNPRFDRWTLRGLDGKVKRSFELYGYAWGNAWTGSNMWEDYIYRDGLLLWLSYSWGGSFSTSLDHLGTWRVAANVYGGLTRYKVYYPFGEEILAAGTTSQDNERTRFTGHERDLASLTSTYPNSPQADDLDYMHARHYSFLTGRLLSTDVVGGTARAPQSWNRYAYVRGNPLKLIDPNGKCAAPTGLQEGQVGICIENFIAAARIGIIGFGDNRTFQATDPDDKHHYRTSVKMIIDPKSGKIVSLVPDAGVSQIGLATPAFGLKGSIDLQGGSNSEGGMTRFSLYFTGQNGFASVTPWLGSIGTQVNFTVDSSGAVEVDRSASSTKGFPSVEGYAYTMVEGQVVVQVLFQVPEQDPSQLNGPMDVPLTTPP